MSATRASSAAVSIDPLGPPGEFATPGPDVLVTVQEGAPEQEQLAEKPAESVAERWLDWQCRMLSGVNCGAVFLIRSAGYGGFKPTAVWPSEDRLSSVLRSVAEQAITRRSPVTHKDSEDDEPDAEVADFVAYPLFNEEVVVGAVAMSLAIRSETQRNAVQQLLQWGMIWLEHAVNSETADRSEASFLALRAVELLSRDLPLPVVGHELCNLLADRFDCSHVALGTWAGLQVRILALSHQLQFDRRVSQIGQLELAMEECVDQGSPIAVPDLSGKGNVAARAHQQLLLEESNGSVCSVPLTADGESVGALTLIRDNDRGFDEVALKLVAVVAASVGSLVHLKQREERSGWRRWGQSFTSFSSRLFGAGHLRTKVFAGSAALLLAALMLIQTDQRIAANSVVDGTLQQAVVAPFDGYLSSANARAGDQVEQGQVLAVLDDRDLLLEQEKWASERDKHGKEYQQALAIRDRAQVSVMAARIAQAEAQLHLVEEQLQRTKLRAPFSGVLVSGDLSRALGAPVERGQLLFEIVPDEDYRVTLEVDEHDVALLAQGQPAVLRLTGMPDRAIPLQVSRIFPVATAEDGANHFRVEAELQEMPQGLRPGMQGVAKVVVGRASLLNVWTRSLVDRLRLWFWSFGL